MKHTLHVFLLLLMLTTTVQGQSPVQLGEKIAYIDSNGTVVNRDMFRRGTPFSDGLAAVDVAGKGQKPKWFFIATDYTIQIPYGYDTVGQFTGALCPVKKGDSWFYIGRDGLIRIDAKFHEAGNFRHGLARVKDDNGVYLIDTLGEKQTNQYFEDISTWNDSVFGARPKREPYWILMNFEGAVVLKDSFYGVWPSEDHTICVNRLGGYRFLDYQGNLLFGKAFLEAGPFSQGWASVRIENDWFLMDGQGRVKKDLRLKTSVLMSGAMSPAINYNGKTGFLSRDANWIYRMP
jgi:hypothetical protein